MAAASVALTTDRAVSQFFETHQFRGINGKALAAIIETDGVVADSELGRTFISPKSCSILEAASLQPFQCLLVHTMKHKASKLLTSKKLPPKASPGCWK